MCQQINHVTAILDKLCDKLTDSANSRLLTFQFVKRTRFASTRLRYRLADFKSICIDANKTTTQPFITLLALYQLFFSCRHQAMGIINNTDSNENIRKFYLNEEIVEVIDLFLKTIFVSYIETEFEFD